MLCAYDRLYLNAEHQGVQVSGGAWTHRWENFCTYWSREAGWKLSCAFYFDPDFLCICFCLHVFLLLILCPVALMQEPAKPMKRYVPFEGVGRTLGTTTTTTPAASESTVASSSLNTAPLPSIGLVVDESSPSTSIQLRLADGTRMVSRFNHHHRIRDIRDFIEASRPGGARTYQLLTMGFPPKQLADLDQTIDQAGIGNSVVIQKF